MNDQGLVYVGIACALVVFILIVAVIGIVRATIRIHAKDPEQPPDEMRVCCRTFFDEPHARRCLIVRPYEQPEERGRADPGDV